MECRSGSPTPILTPHDEQSSLGLFYNGNNPNNLRSAYGNSDFDRTHVINFNYLVQLHNFFSESSWEGKLPMAGHSTASP